MNLQKLVIIHSSEMSSLSFINIFDSFYIIMLSDFSFLLQSYKRIILVKLFVFMQKFRNKKKTLNSKEKPNYLIKMTNSI